MRTRQVGKTQLEICELAFGGASIETVSDAEAASVLQAAWDGDRHAGKDPPDRRDLPAVRRTVARSGAQLARNLANYAFPIPSEFWVQFAASGLARHYSLAG